MKILTMSHGKHSKPCPRLGRMHRHCIDSLQIPILQPCISPRPCRSRSPICQVKTPFYGVQPPSSKVLPPDNQNSDPPLVCQNPAISCQIPRPAYLNPPCKYPPPGKNCHSDIRQRRRDVSKDTLPPCQITNSASQDLSPVCQVAPSRHEKLPACQLPHSTCQANSNAGQIRTPCQVSPRKCPVELPDHQFPPSFCFPKPFPETKQQPISQCDEYERSADYDYEYNTYNDCNGKCVQLESKCQNVQENLDQPYSRDTFHNNQQEIDESYNEDIDNRSSKRSFYSSTPKRTHQNNFDDIENSAQIENNIKKCTQAFLNKFSEGTRITENTGMSTINSAEPNYRNTSRYSTSEAHKGNHIPNYENTARNSTAERRGRNQRPNYQDAIGFSTPQHFEEHLISKNYQKGLGFMTRERDGKNQVPNLGDTAGYSFSEPYGGNKVSTYQGSQDTDEYSTLESYKENHIASNPSTDCFSSPERYTDKQIPAGYYTPERYDGSLSKNNEIDQSCSIEPLQSTGFTTAKRFGDNHNIQKTNGYSTRNRYQETNISNDTNASQTAKHFPKNDGELPVFEENSPLNSLNSESRSSESTSCVQPGILRERAFKINLHKNDKYNQATPEVHDQQTGMDNNLHSRHYYDHLDEAVSPDQPPQNYLKINKYSEMCHKCCGTSFHDSTPNRTGTYTINEKVQDSKINRSLARNAENIASNERDKMKGNIEANSPRRPVLQNPSINVSLEGTQVISRIPRLQSTKKK